MSHCPSPGVSSAAAQSIRKILLLLALSIALAPRALALEGSLQVVTFPGPITGQPVTFSLYLPAGYSTGSTRYPVVYHLHGIGGTHNGPQTNLVPASLELAVAAGVIEPCIIVFPDGYRDAFWADSANSPKPAETNIRLEIIPYVDANFRTVSHRNRRAVQGFSMGGFGDAKFAAKFPELFSACVIYDGAMLTWTQIQQRHATQAAEIFNNSSSVFDQHSPWHWVMQNAGVLRAGMPFRQALGALQSENQAWRDALLAQGINNDYRQTGCEHVLGCLLDAEGSNSWAFIQAAFRSADNADGSGLRLTLSRQTNHAVLTWPAAPDRIYTVEHRALPADTAGWQPLATNLAGSNGLLSFVHSNAFAASSGFYRLTHTAAPVNPFTFNWTGTNFTYTDSQRTFTGIMLKPPGEGPFPVAVISHGAGGSATGYSLTKAREMSPWGLLCIAPTLTHVSGGETNAVNMGFCPENLARIQACLDVAASLSYADTNRAALFGHSMGAFATVGSAGTLGHKLRAAAISAGGVIPDSAGATNATPTVSEANGLRAPLLMIHCDGDPVVPLSRSQLLAQVVTSNGVPNLSVIIKSNSLPNPAHWHNIHQDPVANEIVLTNTRAWFKTHGVLPPD